MSEATKPPYAHATRMRDHWWWRPGMKHGRKFYTYFVTFDDHTSLHTLVDTYQQRLRQVPGLDMIPRQWLHLTVQGIGFADEIGDQLRDTIHDAVRAELTNVEAPTVTFAPVVLHPEAIVLPAIPPTPLIAARDAIRRGIGNVLGPDNIGGTHDGYRPHATLAYNSRDRDSAEVLDAIQDARPEPVTLTINSIDLVTMNRDNRMYQWDHRLPAQLAQ